MLPRSWFVAGLLAIALSIGCTPHGRNNAAANGEKGYQPLFNGKDLSGWYYARTPQGKEHKSGAGYQVRPEDGVLYCTTNDSGRLMSEKAYADFSLRFEFKLTPNANNGVAIRSSPDGNPAYRGMEIQILDDSGVKYNPPVRTLRPTQYHGSIYDVVPAKRGHQKPVGEWNEQEIIAKGRRITVILNGVTIVDADLDDITDEFVLAKHPGLKYEKGHIGFLGHSTTVEFRNVRIKEL